LKKKKRERERERERRKREKEQIFYPVKECNPVSISANSFAL